ncbi:nitrogen fixation protein, partial [Gilvimarinus sp. 1_MG-2023]
ELVWNLTLSPAGSLHEWHVRGDGNRHPLHEVDIAICGSAGEGVTRRLAERHTTLVATSESDPVTAVIAYLNSNLAPGRPHEELPCLDPEHRQA